jgi:hypothetical protein
MTMLRPCPCRWASDLGIFSEPWKMETSGVRLQLRACSPSEKEKSVARNSEAMREELESEFYFDEASNQVGGILQQMFPLLQALENMRLSIKDVELIILHPHNLGEPLLTVSVVKCLHARISHHYHSTIHNNSRTNDYLSEYASSATAAASTFISFSIHLKISQLVI